MMGFGMMGGGFLGLIIIGVVLYLILNNSSQHNNNNYKRNTAKEILDETYAKGEISEEEYLQKKKTLKD